MSFDFIFFGVFFLLIIFDLIKCSDKGVFVVLCLFSFFVITGYLIPYIALTILSFNLFHFIAFFILIIFLNIRFRLDLILSLFLSFFLNFF